MATRHIDLLIDELGKELELPGLRLSDEGACVIGTENSLEIVLNYVEDDDLLVTYASLGRIPDEKREMVYEALLKGNFGFQNARGTTFGTTARGRQVVLQSYTRVEPLDVTSLTATLDHFSHWASLWAEIIQDIGSEPDGGASVVPPSDPRAFV